LNLRHLEAFSAVMRAGSVSQAAKDMHLSQPAVSKLLADLEHAIGFALFLRSRGAALLPTPEAELFHQEVERSIVGVAALKRIAQDIRNLSTGTVRIAALPALAVSFLPAVVKRFQDRHPNVTIQIQTRSSSTVRQWVARQQFDFGLATPARDMEGLHSTTFLKCSGVCVLPPGHRLSSLETVTPHDLAGEAFISLALEDPTRRRVDRVFEDAGVERELLVETQYAMTVCAMVLEGVGCSILNPVTAATFAAHGLVLRPFTPRIVFEYSLITPKSRVASQASLNFIRIMTEMRDAFTERGAFDGAARDRSTTNHRHRS
jgi:DNA-binding transcriptional LysR family regulator